MTTSVSSFSFVQQMLTRYGMSTYVTFGNIGNLLTLCVFYQSDQRQNPCSLYLFCMTICNLICLDVGIIPIIYFLDHIDITTKSLLACKIQFYFRHAFFQIMRTYKVLACIDRYAICSFNVHIRSFSNRKIAVRLILISALFWLIFCTFFGVVRTIQNGSCNIFDRVYSTIYAIYYIIFAGILPPLLILIFTLLVMSSLKQLRNRVQPSTNENGEGNQLRRTNLRKRDHQLLRMVFIEVLFYVITTFPLSIYLIYKMISDNNSIKSRERQQIESFIYYITQSFVMYLNTASPFYIYFLTSPAFRNQSKQIIIRIYMFITRTKIRKERNDSNQTATIRN